MSVNLISHIALHVESLRQAARFYARLFDLQVLPWDGPREGEHPVLTMPSAQGQVPGSEAAIDRCILGREGFKLALRDDAPDTVGSGRVAHIGVQLKDGDLASLIERAEPLGCRILRRGDVSLLLQDVYGICWHVSVGGAGGSEGGGEANP